MSMEIALRDRIIVALDVETLDEALRRGWLAIQEKDVAVVAQLRVRNESRHCVFLMAGEVEQLYRREGKEPPITMIWGLWFLLPIIGNIIWYVRIQKSINDYWTAHGVAPI